MELLMLQKSRMYLDSLRGLMELMEGSPPINAQSTLGAVMR